MARRPEEPCRHPIDGRSGGHGDEARIAGTQADDGDAAGHDRTVSRPRRHGLLARPPLAGAVVAVAPTGGTTVAVLSSQLPYLLATVTSARRMMIAIARWNASWSASGTVCSNGPAARRTTAPGSNRPERRARSGPRRRWSAPDRGCRRSPRRPSASPRRTGPPGSPCHTRSRRRSPALALGRLLLATVAMSSPPSSRAFTALASASLAAEHGARGRPGCSRP